MSDRKINPLLGVLAALIFAESALLAAVSAFLVYELLASSASSFASALFLIVLAVAAAVWLAVIGLQTLRGARWIRGAALVWQVLQAAVAIGCFQGLFARPDIGWLLLVPAIAVVALLFARPVVAATSRPPG